MIGSISNLVSTFVHPVFNVVIGTFDGAYTAYRLSEKREREARIELQNREYLLPIVVRPLVEALRKERRPAPTLSLFDIENILAAFEGRYYLSRVLRRRLQEYVSLGYDYRRASSELYRDAVRWFEGMLKAHGISYTAQGTHFRNISVALSWLEEGTDVGQLFSPVPLDQSGAGYGLLGGGAPSQVFYVDPVTVQECLDDLRSITLDFQREFRCHSRSRRLEVLREELQARNTELEELLGKV